MSLEREGMRYGAPVVPPDPVISIPDEPDALGMADGGGMSERTAAAVTVSIPYLVWRRLRWLTAPLWAWLARRVGERAATVAREEANARLRLVVARYERRVWAAQRDAAKWKAKAEVAEMEAEAVTTMHARVNAMVDLDLLATRAAHTHIVRSMQPRGDG